MGRHAEGPKLWADPRTGIHHVRFTHQKQRHLISTGETDRGRAEEKKAGIYADAIKGGRRVKRGPDAPLEGILVEWLCAVETQLADITMAKSYARRFIEVFGTLNGITAASVADYRRTRLREVKRVTVLKELSALRTFLAWCKEQEILADPPEVEPPAKNVTGTADTSRPHKAKATKITPAEAAAIIKRLPVESVRARRGSERHPVRDFFVVAWETALRPVTIRRLRAPQHYRKGAKEVFLPREIDKARFERGLPITPKARAALDRWCPVEGLIFGVHDYRIPLAEALAAAVEAGAIKPERAALISLYDFRHGRTTQLANSTKKLGSVQYLVGHRHLSTTAKYVEVNKESAEELLRETTKESGRR